MLNDKCEANRALPESQLNAQIICVDGVPVGFHTINPLAKGEFGIFHAHILDESMRGKGIGVQSYPLACKVFVQRFDLKKIFFKTPRQNTGAIKVKEKLSIPEIGEEELDFGIYRQGVKARVFELTADKL